MATTMKWRLCKCEVNGLIRPTNGPLKITKTDMKSDDVLVANIGGAVKTKIATIRDRGKYYVVAPEKLGGIREVPADSLTDCLHASVWSLGQEIKKGKLLSEGKKLSRKEQLKAMTKLKLGKKLEAKS